MSVQKFERGCISKEGHKFAESDLGGQLYCVHCGVILESLYWLRPKQKKRKPKNRGKSPRQKLWSTEDHVCFYCRIEFESIEEATCDHVIPQSKGGLWKLDNLVLACHFCNTLKSSHTQMWLYDQPKFRERLLTSLERRGNG